MINLHYGPDDVEVSNYMSPYGFKQLAKTNAAK